MFFMSQILTDDYCCECLNLFLNEMDHIVEGTDHITHFDSRVTFYSKEEHSTGQSNIKTAIFKLQKIIRFEHFHKKEMYFPLN